MYGMFATPTKKMDEGAAFIGKREESIDWGNGI